MDPTANMMEQWRILCRMRCRRTRAGDHDRLRELREALSEWHRRGGFRPQLERPFCNC